jgi:ABC-type bacteriocin/lantibiotic exporter with double-glycine peptidase domain
MRANSNRTVKDSVSSIAAELESHERSKKLDFSRKISIAERLAYKNRLVPRRISLNGAWWKTDVGPLLAFLADNSQVNSAAVVVVRGFLGYSFINPISKQTERVGEINSGFFNPLGLAFYRALERPVRSQKPNPALKSLFSCLVSESKLELILITVCSLLGLGSTLLIPGLTKTIIDLTISHESPEALIREMVIFAGLMLSLVIIEFSRQILMIRVDVKVPLSFHSSALAYLLELPVSILKRYTGSQIGRIFSDTYQFSDLLLSGILQASFYLVTACTSLVIACCYDFRLVGISFIITAIYLFVSFFIAKSQIASLEKLNSSREKLSTVTFNFITGIMKLQLAGATARAWNAWKSFFNENCRDNWRMDRLVGLQSLHDIIYLSSLSPICLYTAVALGWIHNRLGNQRCLSPIPAFTTCLSRNRTSFI